MNKTLIRTFRDNMLAYGYPDMDVEELMALILAGDAFKEEFKAGSIIPALATSWLHAKGIRYQTEDFDPKTISRRDMQQLSRLYYDMFEDINKREADWYAHQVIAYVSHPSYWRDAGIRMSFIWHIKLNLSALNIAEEDVDEAWHNAFDEHYRTVHDCIDKIAKEYM